MVGGRDLFPAVAGKRSRAQTLKPEDFGFTQIKSGDTLQVQKKPGW